MINIKIPQNGTIEFAKSFPKITPKEPPATNIALWESFPFEVFNVTSAPFICTQALPKHNIIKAMYTLILIPKNII